MSRVLAERLPSYLLRLSLAYERAGKSLESNLIKVSHFALDEDVTYDNWNGGTYGHNVTLFLPIEDLTLIDLDDQASLTDQLCKDLNSLGRSAENELYNAVHIELADENDPTFRRALPFSTKSPANPDTLSIWEKGLGRIFISHRDKHKVQARDLAEALSTYGFSSFVAHETIPANEEWRKVILGGLETMEIMLVFLTDDFEGSIWTMQEVGYALGRNVPIISLKVGGKDPPGFISHVQAMKSTMEMPIASAQKLFPLIAKLLGREDRLTDILVAHFAGAPSWTDARSRFDRLVAVVKTLNADHLAAIVAAFKVNENLSTAIYLTNHYKRLQKYLESATGQRFEITGKELRVVVDDDDVPF